MKKILLEGTISSGKTTLCQVLNGNDIECKKTMEIEVRDTIIDTPGEYLENRAFRKALYVASVECEMILFLQDASDDKFCYSPSIAQRFCIPVIGVVTKIDISTPEQIERARQLLELAGVSEIYEVSALTGEGIEKLKEILAD